MRNNDRGGYTVPTAGLYPYQWNWDSAFAAWGFSTFDMPRAWTELDTLFSAQWDNGMVPHIIFHKVDSSYFPGPNVWQTGQTPQTSGISQPPVAATFARKLFERDPEFGLERIRTLFPGLLKWHRWFMSHRCEDGAIAVTHPWESGRDNSPDWDVAMANIDTRDVGEYQRRDTSHVNPEMRPKKEDYDRYLAIVYFGRDCGWDEAEIRKNGPFRVLDPGTTFILLRACRDLAFLAERLGENDAEIAVWIETLERGVKRLWNPQTEHFDAFDLRSEGFVGSLSSSAFLCWYAGVDEPRMLPHLERVWQDVQYGVPSFDPNSPKFDALRYWRGPVWGIVNALIGLGLEEAGLTSQAERLRRDSAAMIEQSGFAENYDSTNGNPAGGLEFTWTAAIWLAWLSQQGHKGT